MQRKSVMTAAAAIIASRVPGPFREAGGLPGETSRSRFDTAARAYLFSRRVRETGATAALERAAPVALLPHGVRVSEYWGSRGGFGSTWEHNGDRLRWTESTADAGLRFIGWADELPGGPSRYTGWFADADQRETIRGGVWQFPGHGGRARLVYGFAEFEGSRETNPGSAAIVVSDVLESEPCRDWQDVRDLPEIRDAARWADGLAESIAEERRDYREAYDKGREAAEADAEALAARAKVRPLLRELKAACRVPMARAAFPAAIAALRERIDSLLETISEKRAERDSAWDDVRTWSLEAWRAGFMDEAGFVRTVRLGYASREDWRGKPDENPCNGEALA